jgi:hypothetical protein
MMLLASVAQLVEQLTLNQRVKGSSPFRGTCAIHGRPTQNSAGLLHFQAFRRTRSMLRF